MKFEKCHACPQGYHSSNPYHNGVHAADVTQAMNCFLQENSIRRHLRPVETMAALVAAVCHDLDHPGKNEKFLIATRNPLTCMYGDSSVLENHHWRAAIALMRESGVMEAIEAAGEGADFQVKRQAARSPNSFVLFWFITHYFISNRSFDFRSFFSNGLDSNRISFL